MALFRLLPRDEAFFKLFEQATDTAHQAAQTLLQMLQDMPNVETYRQQIADLEHAGDTTIHAVMDKLNRTFVTPLDHEDIRAIADRLDDITDYTQAAAERIVLYHATAPYEDSIELVQVLVQATGEVQKLMRFIRNLEQRQPICELCIEINRLENVGDHIYRHAMSELFKRGDVLELMRWKEIFEQIEQAIDQCEDLADVIEGVVIKHA